MRGESHARSLPSPRRAGVSTYELDEYGLVSAHTLSALCLNGRQLPSSTLGQWLALNVRPHARHHRQICTSRRAPL
eukprot:6185395-Pleurochrysis_carterae.AAC.2